MVEEGANIEPRTLNLERRPLAFQSIPIPHDQFLIVDWPTCYYIAAHARLDQTGTDGFVYHSRLVPDRFGG